jgi:hypothetical protein
MFNDAMLKAHRDEVRSTGSDSEIQILEAIVDPLLAHVRPRVGH